MPGTHWSTHFRERFSTSKHDPDLYSVLGKKWLHECITLHKQCGAGTIMALPQEMPTRVIDLGDPPGRIPPRLLLTSPQMRKSYVALSYCRGLSPNFFTLNTKTMGGMFRSLAESKLSKTHRETIAVARALGIQYVWIDALCIVQDNPADWEFETKRMHRVYGNAALTIIAGRSAEAKSGFIHSQLRQPARSCAIPMGTASHQGCLFAALPRARRVGPVTMRRWCYQEKLLSRRILVFGEEQLFFQCRTGTQYEDGESVLHHAADATLSLAVFRPLADTNVDADPAERREWTLCRWYEILRQYTARRLSNPHDIFAAIASVAALANETLQSRYLAGLWETDLPRGLLWKPRYQAEEGPFPSVARPAPTRLTSSSPVIRAPSWSWAAVDGPVSPMSDESSAPLFRAPDGVKIRPQDPLGRWTTSDEWALGNSGVEKLRMPSCALGVVGRLALASSIPMAVQEHLPLGKSRWEHWKHPYPPSALRAHGMLLVAEDSATAPIPRELRVVVAIGVMDVSNEMQDGSFWCLQVIPDEGLLLRKVADGSYRRVGWFLLEQPSWFEQCKEVDICLV